MRILTSACFTAALLPISGLNALANPIDKLQSETSAFLGIQTAATNSEFIQAQNYNLFEPKSSTTNPITTNPIVAQVDHAIWGNSEKLTADNTWSESDSVDPNKVQNIQRQLQNIQRQSFLPSRGSPAITIANPLGVGADRGFFSGFGFQESVRFSPGSSDATMAFGAGFGDAKKTVGVELSYLMASFGGSRDFGSGGFNLKIHRQFNESFAVATGWNSFLSVGGDNDLEDSLYLVGTKIFKTREDLNAPFSRVALTLGTGNGQFRTLDAINDDDGGFNVFGSLALRVARPVSFITEWTGQDLGLGLSVSPFRNIPMTVNLGLRDVAGEGDRARFVAGIGAAF